jgi:hypothetical protein
MRLTLSRSFDASISGLPTRFEPVVAAYWEGDRFGYSGLHYLRRIAAHLALRGALPAPGDDGASDDPVLAEYFTRATEEPRGLRRFFGRPKRPRLRFDPLILRSDAEGFYLPIDFTDVLFC